MLSGVSVRIEDEDGTVFTGDLDRLASAGALIEQVVARFPIVRGNPFADGLPWWLDWLEGLDVERRVGWWWDVDDEFPKSVEPKEELNFAGTEERIHNCPGVPVDFLEREWGAQKILCQALSAFGVAGGDGFFPAVDVEAAVVPGEKFGDFLGAEVFGLAEGLEEPVAEKFGDRSEAFLWH